ncbi:hypothetical protein Tco_0349580 [Tanacetum coccineum]
MNWGEVNPVHAYYNGSCTSKDNEDPSWSTSFKTRRTQKTSSALEVLWKTLFLLYLYMIGTFEEEKLLGLEERSSSFNLDPSILTNSEFINMSPWISPRYFNQWDALGSPA